ncbi:MAG TPA: carboxylate-amine ligase, partial [Solirubrobacterales bacterium]|nr:carboxylate-amine ligase [Solirubrobacterales bacterium]
VRPQPRFGTVEVRIMDAQTTLADTAGLAALVQCIVRLEVEEGAQTFDAGIPAEVLAENRFLAARDGMDAELIEPELGERVPARGLLDELLVECRPHAEELDCAKELETVATLADRTGARRQLELSRSLGSLPRLVAVLADEFLARG